MRWADTARREHRRECAGYPSDLREGEWELIAPMLPGARTGGRPRKTCLRRVMNAILYIASSGGAWRMLPKCFPPVSTVRGYFYRWRDSGLLAAINHILVMTARQQVGREASPSDFGLVSDLCRSPISLCHLGFECERADAAQI